MEITALRSVSGGAAVQAAAGAVVSVHLAGLSPGPPAPWAPAKELVTGDQRPGERVRRSVGTRTAADYSSLTVISRLLNV